MNLDELNTAPDDVLMPALLLCADIPSWAEGVRDARPYSDLEDLVDTADRLAHGFTDEEVEQALAAHPRIGDRAEGMSKQEQSGVVPSDELVEVNRAYEERFGRVFLICATGLSAPQIIANARERLGNDDGSERAVVADELRKITLLRLRKVVG